MGISGLNAAQEDLLRHMYDKGMILFGERDVSLDLSPQRVTPWSILKQIGRELHAQGRREGAPFDKMISLTDQGDLLADVVRKSLITLDQLCVPQPLTYLNAREVIGNNSGHLLVDLDTSWDDTELEKIHCLQRNRYKLQVLTLLRTRHAHDLDADIRITSVFTTDAIEKYFDVKTDAQMAAALR